MSANNLPYDLPPHFESRCATTFACLQGGEPMTIEYLVDQLGLPFEFFATALAVHSAVTPRVPALVDYGLSQPLH